MLRRETIKSFCLLDFLNNLIVLKHLIISFLLILFVEILLDVLALPRMNTFRSLRHVSGELVRVTLGPILLVDRHGVVHFRIARIRCDPHRLAGISASVWILSFSHLS